MASAACQESSFCAWRNVFKEGTQWTYSQVNPPNDPGNTWFYVGSEANDQISSYRNNRSHRTFVDADYPAEGGEECVAPGGEEPNLTESTYLIGGGAMNDSISAIYLDTTTLLLC
ncbi:MAG: peptidase inhibitor family I36 protein [Solirubrobacteraceae bacterium]